MAPSNGASLKQEELDEILRHGTVELFREPEGGEGVRPCAVPFSFLFSFYSYSETQHYIFCFVFSVVSS